MAEDNGRPSDHHHLVAVVFRTLRWYLAEQQCLAEDNRTLCETFGKAFPPPASAGGCRVGPSSSTSPRPQPQPSAARQQQQRASAARQQQQHASSSFTMDQLLGWLTQVLNAKSALVRAYREFFGAVAPMATGKIEYQVSVAGFEYTLNYESFYEFFLSGSLLSVRCLYLRANRSSRSLTVSTRIDET